MYLSEIPKTSSEIEAEEKKSKMGVMWTLTMTFKSAKTRDSDLGFSAFNAYRYRVLSSPTRLGPLFTLSATLARLRCLEKGSTGHVITLP